MKKTMRTDNEIKLFNDAIEKCARPVWLVSSDGTAFNMKKAEEHDRAMTMWIRDVNDEMEIFASSLEDEGVMLEFWMHLHAA